MGEIDVSDGRWRQNVLMTDNYIEKSPTERKKSPT